MERRECALQWFSIKGARETTYFFNVFRQKNYAPLCRVILYYYHYCYYVHVDFSLAASHKHVNYQHMEIRFTSYNTVIIYTFYIPSWYYVICVPQYYHVIHKIQFNLIPIEEIKKKNLSIIC